jgi:nitroreductase
VDVFEAINNRKSCRRYSERSVDKKLLEKVCIQAAKAPSAINLQPWLFTIVCGGELLRLSKKLICAYKEMGVSCKPASTSVLPEYYINRQKELSKAMGPAIKATQSDWTDFINEGSLNFYGAPAAVIISGDDAFEHAAQFDLGLATAYLLLSCAENGLSTCPVGLVSRYGDIIQDFLNIPPERKVIMAVTIGYPLEGAKVNEVKTPRVDPSEVIRWYG